MSVNVKSSPASRMTISDLHYFSNGCRNFAGQILFLAFLLCASLPLQATAAELSADDRADVARVTEYLNGVKSLQADFMQIGPRGEVAEGRLFLRRPGRLRFEYAPPSPLLLLADGLWLILYDRELDQVSRWPIYDTPIGVLVAEEVDLMKNTKVTGVDRKPGILAITFTDRDDPDEGSVTVVFSDPPLTLRQWQVIDARGAPTNLSLRNPRINIPLDAGLFIFEDKTDQTQDQGK